MKRPEPNSLCPGCGEWVEDPDGFGVLYHPECGYCVHASQAGDGQGGWVCQDCGAQVPTTAHMPEAGA